MSGHLWNRWGQLARQRWAVRGHTLQRAGSGEVQLAGWDPRTLCSCLGIGFPRHLLRARLQELSCQTKAGNYPRLIHTFLVCVLIEI